MRAGSVSNSRFPLRPGWATLGRLVPHPVPARAPSPAHANRGPLYRFGVSSTKRIGNWTPDGKVERARLRRDYLELSGAERMKQVFELSRFMSRVAAAGRRARSGRARHPGPPRGAGRRRRRVPGHRWQDLEDLKKLREAREDG